MKLFKRIVVMFGVFTLMSFGQAAAAPYGFDFVLNGALRQGGSTQVHVEGFVPGAKVTVLLVRASSAGPVGLLRANPAPETVLAEPIADKDGVVDLIVTVPADLPSGQYAITVSGAAAAGGIKTASFNLTVGATTAGGTLPTTGSSPSSLLSLAAGIVALGATGVLATRLRHRTIEVAA